MSGSDRSIRSAIVAYAGPVAVVLLIVVVCGFLIGQLWESKASRDSYRREAPATNSVPKQYPCIEAPGLLILCPREKEESPAETQRAQQDLSAQQEMADWAFYVLIASVIGIGISAAGFVFLFQTLIETRNTATAAIEANKLQRLSQRPWVDITLDNIGAFNAVPRGDTQAYIQIKNIGNYVARDCKYFCEFYTGGTVEYEAANIALVKRLKEWPHSALTAIVGYDERHVHPIFFPEEIAVEVESEASFGIAVAMRYRDYGGQTYFTTKNYMLIKNTSMMFKANEVHFGVSLLHDMNRDVLF